METLWDFNRSTNYNVLTKLKGREREREEEGRREIRVHTHYVHGILCTSDLSHTNMQEFLETLCGFMLHVY